MQTPLLIAQMILAISLIASILLQQRGTGLGGAFGGEVTAYRSRRGIERTLFRMTVVLAILFVAFSLLNLLPQSLIGAARAIIGPRNRNPLRMRPCRGGGIGRRARFRT